MPKKVLIVEDYEDTRQFMRVLLESSGYQVFEAEDGIEAIDIFKKIQPDLVLMDMSLPMVDGITTTKAMKEFNQHFQVPIIALTAFGQSYREKALEAGCDDFLAKPVDFNELRAILNQYLAADQKEEASIS